MIPAATVIGIDVSRDWLDGFYAPSGRRFRLPNNAAGQAQLLIQIQDFSQPVRFGFEGREDQKTIRGIVFPTGGRSGMGALVTLVAAGVGCATTTGTDQGLCPFPGHTGKDRPDRCRAHRAVHAVQA